jgi:hypothetical protein
MTRKVIMMTYQDQGYQGKKAPMSPRARERKVVWSRKKGVARKWEAATWFFSGACKGLVRERRESDLAQEVTLPRRLGHHQGGDDDGDQQIESEDRIILNRDHGLQIDFPFPTSFPLSFIY